MRQRGVFDISVLGLPGKDNVTFVIPRRIWARRLPPVQGFSAGVVLHIWGVWQTLTSAGFGISERTVV